LLRDGGERGRDRDAAAAGGPEKTNYELHGNSLLVCRRLSARIKTSFSREKKARVLRVMAR
jgi:hypothetical protein